MKFDLASTVFIGTHGAQGIVVSRTEHVKQQTMYLLEYPDAGGTSTQSWWAENDLSVEAPESMHREMPVEK
jgi:hypothetical protein